MASKTSNTSCPAEKYKDIKCPQTKKGQKKILLKIHPDRNRGCTELARKLSQKILNCPYEANGNLDNVELITRAMEQKVAAGGSSSCCVCCNKVYCIRNKYYYTICQIFRFIQYVGRGEKFKRNNVGI